MKILVIESSPHKNGSSNLLADYFIRGAKESGHTISTFDAAKASLHTVVISEIISVCILTLVFIFAKPIVTAFGLGSEAVSYCTSHVRFVALCLPLFASYFPLLGLFQSANNALFSTFVATGALTVRVATTYLFQGIPGVGYHMIWWNTLFGWGFSTVVTWVHFIRGKWKIKMNNSN